MDGRGHVEFDGYSTGGARRVQIVGCRKRRGAGEKALASTRTPKAKAVW